MQITMEMAEATERALQEKIKQQVAEVNASLGELRAIQQVKQLLQMPEPETPTDQ